MTIRYDLHGDMDKPLLVFLHGGGVSGWMWDEQVEYFTNYRCLVPDLPGHGESEDGNYFSIRDSAEQIATLIEEHKAGHQVIVIGFSLGAQVLISMLSEHNTLINKAIIISASTKPFPLPKASAKIAAWMLPLARNKVFSRVQAKYMYLNDKHFNNYYQETKAITRETFFNVMFENMSFTIPKGFATTHSEILVLIGEKENSIIKKSLTDILESNGRCSAIVIPNVGHGIPLHNPKYFNELVENWIENEKIPHDVVSFR